MKIFSPCLVWTCILNIVFMMENMTMIMTMMTNDVNSREMNRKENKRINLIMERRRRRRRRKFQNINLHHYERSIMVEKKNSEWNSGSDHSFIHFAYCFLFSILFQLRSMFDMMCVCVCLKVMEIFLLPQTFEQRFGYLKNFFFVRVIVN